MKKTPIDRRLAAATARTLNALGTFEKAAVELEAAADEAEQVVAEANRRAEELLAVRGAASEQATRARVRATKIREFIK